MRGLSFKRKTKGLPAIRESQSSLKPALFNYILWLGRREPVVAAVFRYVDGEKPVMDRNSLDR